MARLPTAPLDDGTHPPYTDEAGTRWVWDGGQYVPTSTAGPVDRAPLVPPPPTAPPPGSTPPLGTGGPPGWTGVFTPPTDQPYPTMPGFTPPAYTRPPAYESPTFDEALNDPGYQFAASEGERALRQGRAAEGLLNTGGTLKDILAWGQNYAAQRYGDVDARKFRNYNTNVETQYRQPFEFQYRGAYDAFQPQFSGWQTNMAATQRANENQYQNAYRNFTDTWDRLFKYAQL
jgi:hypothetical protein